MKEGIMPIYTSFHAKKKLLSIINVHKQQRHLFYLHFFFSSFKVITQNLYFSYNSMLIKALPFNIT